MTVCVGIILLALSAAVWGDSITSECMPSVPRHEFRYRFGFATGYTSHAELVDLIENPTPYIVEARAAGRDDPAATVITTETHAVYPIRPDAMFLLLQDSEALPDLIPDLVVDDTICEHSSGMIKQRQRTEFRVLFFTFGTEYLIDAHYVLNGPEEYGGYWGMYDSVDGRRA
jgi:hypothetical protein